MKTIILLLATLFLSQAYAQSEAVVDEAQLRPIVLPEEITIKPGDTKIVPLPRFAFIDRVTLEVKACLLCGQDNFRISFDGMSSQTHVVKGGVYGYRTKIITADVNAHNIEITNTASYKIKIRNIQVLPRRFMMSRGGIGYGPVVIASAAAAQVSFLMESMLYLDALVGDADRINYLSPAKKVLGKALGVLNSAPETSQMSLRAIQDVIAYLHSAEPFFDRLATIETTFEVAQEIQTVKTALERMTR